MGTVSKSIESKWKITGKYTIPNIDQSILDQAKADPNNQMANNPFYRNAQRANNLRTLCEDLDNNKLSPDMLHTEEEILEQLPTARKDPALKDKKDEIKAMNTFLDSECETIREKLATYEPSENPKDYKDYWEKTRKEIEININKQFSDPALQKLALLEAEKRFYVMHGERMLIERDLIIENQEYAEKVEGKKNAAYYDNPLTSPLRALAYHTNYSGKSKEELATTEGYSGTYKIDYTNDKTPYRIDYTVPVGEVFDEKKVDEYPIEISFNNLPTEKQVNITTHGLWTHGVNPNRYINLQFGNTESGVKTACRLLALSGGEPPVQCQGENKLGKPVNPTLSAILCTMQNQKIEANLPAPDMKTLKSMEDMLFKEIGQLESALGVSTIGGKLWEDPSKKANMSQLQIVSEMAKRLSDEYAKITKKLTDQVDFKNDPVKFAADHPGTPTPPPQLTAAEKNVLEKCMHNLSEEDVRKGHEAKLRKKAIDDAKKQAEEAAKKQAKPAEVSLSPEAQSSVAAAPVPDTTTQTHTATFKPAGPK